MISLILPYWNRQEAANKAFELLERCYSSMLDLEIVVVDDGNKIPFVVPETSLNVKVVRLPEKPLPTPQSKAWNAGVKAASGEIVVLSCIEVLHDKPILQRLVSRLKDRKDYAMAAAWCPEMNEWHCHSTANTELIPKGSGPSFCAAIHKDFFDEVGGFDEIYHEGAGYEDKDFLWKLHNAGANFIMCDDLIVTHPKTGATIKWSTDGFRRNSDIFHRRWFGKRPITFVCLKAGDAYGPEYVNILFDMVRRNLREGTPGRFVCITDNPTGLHEAIETIPLPADLETWWGKLYMFKRGLFADGERCIFMDLDTLIIGSIDELVAYDGQFATLRDFYYPQQVGPAIIAWEAGEFAATIWNEWVTDGKPRNPMGDLWWINNLDQGRFAKEIDILQDKFPKMFCSYKADCHPYPPNGTKIVCFHGQPKPSNCGSEWVDNVWKIGGSGMAELDVIANTESKTIAKNVKFSCSLDIPWLDIKEKNESDVVLVAGGPSLKEYLQEIRWRKSIGQTIISCNGATHYLLRNGILPDHQIIIDAKQECYKFVVFGMHSFIASQCHPDIFAEKLRIDEKNITLFNLNTNGILEHIPQNDKPLNLISSGTTVGLAAMAVAYTQGFRKLHLYGYDSSYAETHHAYSQPDNDADHVVDAVAEGRVFKAAPWMIRQVQDFQVLANQLADAGCIITVAGDGLLPWVAKCMGEINAKN